MHRGMMKLAVALAISASWAVVQPARAQTFNSTFFNSTTGHTEMARATFSEVTGSISGTSLVAGSNLYLQIVLTNTSTFSGYQNPDLLGGLFFSIAGNTTNDLTPDLAITPTALINPNQCDSTAVAICSTGPVNVGAQWGYSYSSFGTFSGPALSIVGNYGISAPGYSAITSPAVSHPRSFGTAPPVLVAHASGPQVTLVGANFTDAASSNAVAKDPLLNTSVTFLLGLPTGIGSLHVSAATFTYGTNPDAVHGGVTATPEPASLTILGLGLTLICVARRCKGRLSPV